jgi:hypothetical protein
MKKQIKRREKAGIMIILALFLLVFFSWIILLMLYSYNRWYKTQEMKMLRTKYITPTFRNMKYNVSMINEVIKKKGELIWGSEKFSPFFPIDLGISPYTSKISIQIHPRVLYCDRIKLKLDDINNPDIVLYYEPRGKEGKLLSDKYENICVDLAAFAEFQNRVKAPFANSELIDQVRNSIPIENGRMVENGGITERSYEGIVEKIRGVTYPFVKRLIGYGVVEEVYEVRIRDREMMIENRKYIYHRVRMTPVFKVPREINNKAYKIIDDTDVSLTIVYKINYVVNIEAHYESARDRVRVEVRGNPALELKRIGYGE